MAAGAVALVTKGLHIGHKSVDPSQEYMTRVNRQYTERAAAQAQAQAQGEHDRQWAAAEARQARELQDAHVRTGRRAPARYVYSSPLPCT